MKQLDYETIDIAELETLADILKDGIPTNTIFHKTLCGIGATYLELYRSKRNSIIIEPNLPVIDGKCLDVNGKKRKDIIGVYEKTDVFDIHDYMLNESIEFKKILTTPESYNKIKQAAEAARINLFTEYFMFFDECEHTAKDAAYRSKITSPMHDFFQYQGKAFVSSTTLMPSDPRFAEQGFTKIVVKPTYDFAIRAKLICTNNIYATLANYIKSKRNGGRFFIFFNYVEGIGRIINAFKIKEHAAVFCSEKAANRLKNKGFIAYSQFEPSKLAQVNFMTSRFFPAVDIELDFKPHVIILTSLDMAETSLVDPKSDAIQIVGRFRKGYASVGIISDTNEEIVSMDESERDNFLSENRIAFEQLKTLADASTNRFARNVLRESLDTLPYRQYLHDDFSINHFMIDYLHYSENVKSYYQSPDKLRGSYEEQTHGMVHWELDFQRDKFQTSHGQMKIGRATMNYGEEVTKVVESRAELRKKRIEQGFTIPDPTVEEEEILFRQHPEIMKAVSVMGEEKTLRYRYSKKLLMRQTKNHQETFIGDNIKFLEDLYDSIHEGQQIESGKALDKFQEHVKNHDLPFQRTVEDFEKLFLIKKTQIRNLDGTRLRFFTVLKQKFNV